MDLQDLYELADKEVTLGLADECLLQQALAEAHGVEAHARQIYWRNRAMALQKQTQNTSSDAHILELKS